jgi:hypothetical protein
MGPRSAPKRPERLPLRLGRPATLRAGRILMLQKDSAEKAVRDIRRKTRRKEDPDRTRRPAGRGGHRFALPPGRHRSEFVLPLEQGVSRSGEEALVRIAPGSPFFGHLRDLAVDEPTPLSPPSIPHRQPLRRFAGSGSRRSDVFPDRGRAGMLPVRSPADGPGRAPGCPFPRR